MTEPDQPAVPVAPDYSEAAVRQRRLAAGQERGQAQRAALPAEVKAADARLEAIGVVLSDATRWRILLELAKGAALPVGELAKRLGRPPAAISKHMALLRKAGLVERVFTTCYTLPAALLPTPGAPTLDLGPCLLKLS